MNMDNEAAESVVAPTAQDYSNAMNQIGQNLLSTLAQSVQKLQPQLRNRKVVSQALSAFLANVIYQQFPESHEMRQQLLEELTKVVQVQLENIPKSAAPK